MAPSTLTPGRVELEPDFEVTDGSGFGDGYCHLYWTDTKKAACGYQGTGHIGKPRLWQGGKNCSFCGNLLCPACVDLARRWRRSRIRT